MNLIFDEIAIISGINERNKKTFGKLYSILFRELYYYSAKLYANTEVDPGDAVQDAFLALWQAHHNFDALSNVKAYLFITIKKRFKKYLRQKKYKNRFIDHSKNDLGSFQADVFDTEIFSLIHYVAGMLPEQTAEILRLFFMGWSADEIAQEMGKNKQTIYNIKSQALAILREKLSKDMVCILISVLS